MDNNVSTVGRPLSQSPLMFISPEADKAGVVQCTIGRASFTPEQLSHNLTALVEALNKSKPSSSKGIYLRKLSVSSTMGPGVRVDVGSLTGASQQQ